MKTRAHSDWQTGLKTLCSWQTQTGENTTKGRTNKPQKDEKLGVLSHTEGPFQRRGVYLSQTRAPLGKLEGVLRHPRAYDGEMAISKPFVAVSFIQWGEISKIHWGSTNILRKAFQQNHCKLEPKGTAIRGNKDEAVASPHRLAA